MSDPTITLDLNEDMKCIHCRKGGATPSGRCLRCVVKLVKKYGPDPATWPKSGRV